VECDLKRLLNLIQTINGYYIENKYGLTWYVYYMLYIKSKHNWWKDIDYIEKLVTERLSKTINDFSNI